ncbi:hypothetical protein [Nocardia brasiliensis]|uniref:hypothetical protein n=1 Tax=Nocardia brasiliensis TaxID=37326 RepID=UPI00245758B6|nr:hypothetical protein [Nocardia brasiliensis]
MMPIAHAVPALLLAGPGGVFAALALSYRREMRRSATTGERSGSALAAAAYGCLAALSYVWAVAAAPPPPPFALPALGLGVALLTAMAVQLWGANRACRRGPTLAVSSGAAPVGELEGRSSATTLACGSGSGTRQLALLHRRQCAGARHRHPHGTD